MQKGDADIARSLSPEQIASLKGAQGVSTAKGDSLLLIYVGMNVTASRSTIPSTGGVTHCRGL